MSSERAWDRNDSQSIISYFNLNYFIIMIIHHVHMLVISVFIILLYIVVSQPLLGLIFKLEHLRGTPGAVKMVPEGKYRKPPIQTPAPIEARPGETVPCNLDRAKCFPCLAGSSRARKLIVTISGRFRDSVLSLRELWKRPETDTINFLALLLPANRGNTSPGPNYKVPFLRA